VTQSLSICLRLGSWSQGPGISVIKHLPSARVMIPGSWDRALHWAPCSVGGLLLLSPSPCLCSLCRIKKRKKKKNELSGTAEILLYHTTFLTSGSQRVVLCPGASGPPGNVKNTVFQGRLGGSVGQASDSWFQLGSWSQGGETEPQHGAYLRFSLSFSLCPPLNNTVFQNSLQTCSISSEDGAEQLVCEQSYGWSWSVLRLANYCP